jgi:hypothetical protein
MATVADALTRITLTCRLFPVPLRRIRDMVEGRANFSRECPGVSGRHHALPFAHEQRLTQPVFENGDMPAHRPVRQVKFTRSRGVTDRSSSDFEHA